MSAKGAVFDNEILKMIFNSTSIDSMADNASSSPLSHLYVSLHTASPRSSGDQTTNEAAYAGYARQAVARDSAGWVVTGSIVSPAAPVAFPPATGGRETERFFAVGTAATGPGKLLYFGAISPAVAVASGIQVQLTTATTVVES